MVITPVLHLIVLSVSKSVMCCANISQARILKTLGNCCDIIGFLCNYVFYASKTIHIFLIDCISVKLALCNPMYCVLCI